MFFEPPKLGDINFLLLRREDVFQNNGRVCRLSVEWASGHETDYRTVANVVGDKVTMVAVCSIGLDLTSEACPEDSDSATINTSRHWNMHPTETKSTPALTRYGNKLGGIIPDPDDLADPAPKVGCALA